MSDGIDNPIGFNWKVTISLLACWLIVFLSLSKGLKTLGKASYITASFPFVMIFALVIRGLTLQGSMDGIKYYIGSIDFTKLFSLKVIMRQQKYFKFLSYICCFILLRHGSTRAVKHSFV